MKAHSFLFSSASSLSERSNTRFPGRMAQLHRTLDGRPPSNTQQDRPATSVISPAGIHIGGDSSDRRSTARRIVLRIPVHFFPILCIYSDVGASENQRSPVLIYSPVQWPQAVGLDLPFICASTHLPSMEDRRTASWPIHPRSYLLRS